MSDAKLCQLPIGATKIMASGKRNIATMLCSCRIPVIKKLRKMLTKKYLTVAPMTAIRVEEAR